MILSFPRLKLFRRTAQDLPEPGQLSLDVRRSSVKFETSPVFRHSREISTEEEEDSRAWEWNPRTVGVAFTVIIAREINIPSGQVYRSTFETSSYHNGTLWYAIWKITNLSSVQQSSRNAEKCTTTLNCVNIESYNEHSLQRARSSSATNETKYSIYTLKQSNHPWRR